MKYAVLFLAFLILSGQAFSQKSSADPQYKLLSGGNYVQSKNYYLLTLFDEVAGVKAMLAADPVLSKMTLTHRADLKASLQNCGRALGCYIKAVQFSDAEIKQAGERLSVLYQPDNALGKLVSQHLIPSGCYSLYALSGKALLISAWEQDAKAVNYAIAVYAAGQKPNYAQIDSISFDIKAKGYIELVALNASLSLSETAKTPSFYSSTLTFALHSLEINERNQVADEEPMTERANKAAYNYSKKLKWDQYKYTLILVPGEGPEEKDVALSAGGMLRCRLAVQQYQQGLAPFIMVSGGCVHPYKTKYNEAIEMKKFLMQTLHVPEKAILIEPHARHTTTNLRNCARIIFRYGFPMDKPCISSTAASQSDYITNIVPDRCKKEFGFTPYLNGKRLSATEAEFYPLAVSLQLDFDEPMDP